MTLPTRTLAFWLLLAVVALSLVALALIFAARLADQRADRAEASETLAGARTEAARDASGVRDRSDDRNTGIDQTVRTADDEIRTAPDRDIANRAARRRVCQLDPSAGPDCALLLAHTRAVD